MEKFFFRVVHTKAKAIRTEHSKDKGDENPDLHLCNNESLSKQRRFANRSPCLTWRVTAGVPRLFEADVRQRWLGETVRCQSCWGIAIYAAPSAVCTILMSNPESRYPRGVLLFPRALASGQISLATTFSAGDGEHRGSSLPAWSERTHARCFVRMGYPGTVYIGPGIRYVNGSRRGS